MKESHGEGLATHIGPESCGGTRKSADEALTGGSAGRVFSRVRNSLRDADAVKISGRPHPGRRPRQAPRNPSRSETPRTHGHSSHGNREIPGPPAAARAAGRIGKSKDRRR